MSPAFRPGDLILGALPREKIEEAVDAYLSLGISSFLLPGELLGRPRFLSQLVADIRAELRRAAVGPGFLALGGASGSFGPPASFLPSPLSLGALPPRQGRSEARRMGYWLGHALAALGIDLVFAPRLDLATDPKARGGILETFGDEPRGAGQLGASFIRGLGRAGIGACAGSFPGCGALSSEGRSGLSLVDLPAARLEAVEMQPFALGIKAGLSAVFVPRVLVPGLEPEHIPAARSLRIVEGRLRTALGFKGLAIAGAIGDDPEAPGRAAVLSALAGIDLSLAESTEVAAQALEASKKALDSGELPGSRLLAIQRRRVAFLGRFPRRIPLPSEKLHELWALEGIKRFRSRVREEAATLFKRSEGGLPSANRLLVLCFHPMASEDEELAAARSVLEDELPGADVLVLPAEPESAEVYAFARRLGQEGRYDGALVLSSDAHFAPTQESLIHLLEEGLPSVAVVALEDPYDAAFFPRSRLLGAVYGFSAEGIRLAVRLAQGRLEARGTCPVPVLGLEV